MSEDNFNKKIEEACFRVKSHVVLQNQQSFPDSRLLEAVVDSLRKEFDFLSVDIYLLDASGQSAICKATTSRQKTLMKRVGEDSLIGKVLQRKTSLMIDLEEDRNYELFRDPSQPKARLRFAVPIKFQEKLIGAFDIFSPNQTDKRADLFLYLEALANDIAVICNGLTKASPE
jgi:transcriptional regulator with GAF, ATPase, and Fis domain